MTEIINRAWLTAHPLPIHGEGTDKNSRGRVLLIGGAEFVPGGLRLTGEAALRVGAGKLQMATVRSAAMALGVLIPEAAMIPLPMDEDGEIAAHAAETLAEAAGRCDTMIIGPGMSGRDRTAALLRDLLAEPRAGMNILLDAAAITGVAKLPDLIKAHEGRVVLTPHHGEMASLTGIDIEEIHARPEAIAKDAAARYGAIVVLKSASTIIASPDGKVLTHDGGCPGLATGGSGDVLAGAIGGLMARGADPLTAAAWGVWLHGESGQKAQKDIGPIGFLARDLLEELPRLLTT